MDEITATSSSIIYTMEDIENVIRTCKHFLDLSNSELDVKEIHHFQDHDKDEIPEECERSMCSKNCQDGIRFRQIEKSFMCEICKRTFTRKHHLLSHIMIHTGEKPHKCNLCGRSFRQKSDMNRHSLIHGKVKKFQCNMCGKLFLLKAYLNRHIKIHE